MKVKFTKLALLTVSLIFALSSCSKAKKAADEYCDCEKEPVLKEAKCKANVLLKYREDLANEEFAKEFHDAVESNHK